MQVVAATDRYTRFLLLEDPAKRTDAALVRYFARSASLLDATAERQTVAKDAGGVLERGTLLAVTADGTNNGPDLELLLKELRPASAAPVVPVYCGSLHLPNVHEPRTGAERIRVVFGHPVPDGATLDDIRRSIRLLGQWIHEVEAEGGLAVTAMIPGGAAASPTATAPDRPPHP
jgi:hypothetical protein